MYKTSMALCSLNFFPKTNLFYTIDKFHDIIDTCLDEAEKSLLGEEHLRLFRGLIACSPMAMTEAQKKRFFVLRGSDDKFSGIFEEIFVIVSRQTVEKQQQIFTDSIFMKRLMHYLPKKTRFRLANVSRGMLASTDQIKIAKMNGMNRSSYPTLKEQGFPDIETLLIFLSRHSQKIETLNLHSYNASNEEILAISAACPQLKTLALSSGRLDDQGAALIAQGFQELRVLDLEFCRQITDKGVISIAKEATRLTSLGLDGFKGRKITDVGIKAIAESQMQLDELRLGGCDRITNDVTFVLPEGQRHLRHLNIIGCDGIKRQYIEAMEKRYPALHILTDH